MIKREQRKETERKERWKVSKEKIERGRDKKKR